MVRIDVTGDARLLAMVRALRFVEREWLSAWAKEARTELEPQWKQELEASRPNRLQRAVLVRTSRVAVSRTGVTLKAGTVGKLKQTGTKPSELARAVEFGQDQNLRTKYIRRDKPIPAPDEHLVVRRTARPVGPRAKTGKVVYPALKRFVPKAAAYATQLFYDTWKKIPGAE